MTAFYHFLVQNQSFISDYFPLILSTISLVIAIKTQWDARKRLFFNPSDGVTFQPFHSIYCTDESGHYVPLSGMPEGFRFQIDIVNTSPVAIGYFDLCVFDTESHNQLPLLTKNALDAHLRTFTWKRENKDYPVHPSLLHMPDSWTGFFPANSSTDWDLVCFPPDQCRNITIVFRVAMKKPFWMKRDPFAVGHDRRYLYFSRSFEISYRSEFSDQNQRPEDFTSLEELARNLQDQNDD